MLGWGGANKQRNLVDESKKFHAIPTCILTAESGKTSLAPSKCPPDMGQATLLTPCLVGLLITPTIGQESFCQGNESISNLFEQWETVASRKRAPYTCYTPFEMSTSAEYVTQT